MTNTKRSTYLNGRQTDIEELIAERDRPCYVCGFPVNHNLGRAQCLPCFGDEDGPYDSDVEEGE